MITRRDLLRSIAGTAGLSLLRSTALCCDYGSWGGWRSRVPSSVKSTGAEGPGGWGT